MADEPEAVTTVSAAQAMTLLLLEPFVDLVAAGARGRIQADRAGQIRAGRACARFRPACPQAGWPGAGVVGGAGQAFRLRARLHPQVGRARRDRKEVRWPLRSGCLPLEISGASSRGTEAVAEVGC